MTEDERARLYAAAKNLNQPVGRFCREALLRATAWSLNRPSQPSSEPSRTRLRA